MHVLLQLRGGSIGRLITACRVAGVVSVIICGACPMSEAPRNMHSRRGMSRGRRYSILAFVTLAIAAAGLAVGWFIGQAML